MQNGVLAAILKYCPTSTPQFRVRAFKLEAYREMCSVNPEGGNRIGVGNVLAGGSALLGGDGGTRVKEVLELHTYLIAHKI